MREVPGLCSSFSEFSDVISLGQFFYFLSKPWSLGKSWIGLIESGDMDCVWTWLRSRKVRMRVSYSLIRLSNRRHIKFPILLMTLLSIVFLSCME
jgi:hypothetical protein